MTKFTCNGCKRKDFKNSRSLGVHFQHHKRCKQIHYMLKTKNTSKGNKNSHEIHPSTGLSKSGFISSNTSELRPNKYEQIIEETVTNTEPNVLADFDDSTTSSNDINSYVFTNASRVECNLLKILFDMAAPNYAFKEIMNWAKDAYKTGYKFNPKTTSYKNQILHLQKTNNLEYLCPSIKNLVLPNDDLNLQVTCFNFTSLLSALLNDRDLNIMSNLVVNNKDCFAKYESPSGKLGEVNSGYWYQHAYSTMIQDADKDFLLPIIFAMDKNYNI